MNLFQILGLLTLIRAFQLDRGGVSLDWVVVLQALIGLIFLFVGEYIRLKELKKVKK